MAGKRRVEATRWFQQFYSQEVAERALASASDIIGAVREFYQAHAETDIIEGRLP